MKNILHDLYDGCFIAYERRPVRTTKNIAAYCMIEDEKRHFIQKISLDDCQMVNPLFELTRVQTTN